MSLQTRFRKPKPQPDPVLVKPRPNGEGSLLLNLKQTAVYIGLPLRQIRSLVTAGILKTVPTKPKAFYVARAECDRYVADLIQATQATERILMLKTSEPKIGGTMKKKRTWKLPTRPARPKFQMMTDAQVQEFFRTAQIDDEGRLT
jgi:hypothetical protein